MDTNKHESLRPDPVWRRGRSALYCGDCYPMLHAMPDGMYDAIITDPPYSAKVISRAARCQSTSKKYLDDGIKLARPDFLGDNREQRAYLAWATLWLCEALRATREGGQLMVFADWHQLPTMSDALQAAGWTWHGIVPWDKTEGVRPQRGAFRAQCEYILVGSKGSRGMEQARAVADCVPGIWRGARKADDKLHITGKPVELMRFLMRIVPRGALILDPFAGSGSTIAASLQSGCDCVGIDLSPEYCAIARGRLERAATNI